MMTERSKESFFQQYFQEKVSRVEKIPRQASFRTFWRIFLNGSTLIAIVYPPEKVVEIENYLRVQHVFVQHGLKVAEIVDRPEKNILLVEDLGKVQLSKLDPSEIVDRYGKAVVEIICKLSEINAQLTAYKLDNDRLRFEMDFFLKHFFAHFSDFFKANELLAELELLITKIDQQLVFAHRDFHTKNIHLHANQLYLVDFQDALQAHPYYDLVSFLYDSYKDYGRKREKLLTFYEELSGRRIEKEQLLLVALQRNIKALGTFGFQVFQNRNRQYRFYIARTVNYILQHLVYFPNQFFALRNYFSSLANSITGKIRREG